VPLGFWMEQWFGFTRNHDDGIGHFAQGFVPAIIAREVLLRRSPLTTGKWLFTIVTALCLAISACYEFVEWFSAVIGGSSADAFLGTQADVWDTQWDMLMAFIGAMTAHDLIRLTIRNGRVVSEERLLEPSVGRVRSIAESPDGLLYIGTDGGQLLELSPSRPTE